jgi:hypothetical protein
MKQLFVSARRYNLFRSNIAYEAPSSGGGVDGLGLQHLKFGRDVLRTRAGTCINLAILYASVIEAAGLKPFVIVVPGHAMPAFELPVSKRWIYVETTGCGGGTFKSSLDFITACTEAGKTCKKWLQLKLIKDVDLAKLRKQGVSPPELPDLGINPLSEWQIVMKTIPSSFDNNKRVGVTARTDDQFSADFVRRNASWLYEHDSSGKVLRDPRTGGYLLTPNGKRFVEYLNEARTIGISKPEDAAKYALRMIAADGIKISPRPPVPTIITGPGAAYHYNR